MKTIRLKKITKILIRIILILFGLFVISFILFYLVINHPKSQSFLQKKIRETVGIDAEWKSLSWFVPDHIVISGLSIHEKFPELPYSVNVKKTTISHILRLYPDISASGASILSGTEEIVFVSDFSGRWKETDRKQRLQLFFDQLLVHPLPFLSMPESSNLPVVSESPVIESDEVSSMSIIESIRISNASIETPWIENDYLYDGNISIEPEGRFAELEIALYPRNHKDDYRAQIDATVDLIRYDLHKAEINLNHVPLSMTSPVAMSLVVDGTSSIHADDRNGLLVESQMAFRNISADMVESSSVFLHDASVQSVVSLDEAKQITGATLSLAHSSGQYHDGYLGEVKVPSGFVNVQYHPDAENKFPLLIDGSMELLDQYSVTVNDPLKSATLSWNASAEINPKSIENFTSFLPVDWLEGFDSIKGAISANGNASGNLNEIEIYDGELKLANLTARFGNVRIDDAGIDLSLNGSKGTDQFELNSVINAALLLYGTQELAITPDIHLEGVYSRETGKGKVEIIEVDTEITQSISGWIDTDKKWSIEGVISLEDSVAHVRPILPDWGQDIEGMGDISFHGRGDLNNVDFSSANFEGDCSDLTLYSLSDILSFGVQLKDFEYSGNWQSGSKQHCSLALKMATPYISIGVNDHEWEKETLVMQTNMDNNRIIDVSINPPGGGEIAVNGDIDSELVLHASNLDIERFLIPIIENYILAGEEEYKIPLVVQGKSDCQIRCSIEDDKWKLDGNIVLRVDNLQYNETPALMIKDATLTLPVVYPINEPALGNRAVLFEAKLIDLDGTMYEDVSFSIPMMKDSIQIVSDLTIPIFGGNIGFKDIQIKDWLSSPVLEGLISLDNLELSEIAELLPIVPREGTLSGNIRRIVYTGVRSEIKGDIGLDIFGGKLVVRDMFLRDSFGGNMIVGFSAEIQQFDLALLAEYYQYGMITGVLDGTMNNTQVILPPSGSGELPIPEKLDMKIQSVSEDEGIISQETLLKIIELSGQSDLNLARYKVSKFYYSQIGLHVFLEGINLRLVGSLNDQFLISPSKRFFGNKIGIRLPHSHKTINFLDFWQELLAQIGSPSSVE
jgi:hypothetical protein